MLLVMCRACGTFVQGMTDDGDVVPIRDECPDCGGREFETFEDGGD